MRWTRDLRMEPVLHRLKVPFQVETVPIKDIDLEESLNRQVRLGKKINDDVVIQYALGMEKPEAAFPMCIVNKAKKYIFLWSGNHRVASYNLARETHPDWPDSIECYAVNVYEEQLQDYIPRIVNTFESPIGQTKEESMIHAKHIIEKWGVDIKEVASDMNLSYGGLTHYMRSEEVAEQIKSLGANPNGLSRALRVKLAPLMEGNTGVLREVVKFIKRNELAGAQAEQFVSDVRRGKTESERMKEIKNWGTILEVRKEKTVTPFKNRNRSTFLRMLTSLHHFMQKIDRATELQLEAGEIQKVAQYWNEVEQKMRKFIREEVKS